MKKITKISRGTLQDLPSEFYVFLKVAVSCLSLQTGFPSKDKMLQQHNIHTSTVRLFVRLSLVWLGRDTFGDILETRQAGKKQT